MKLQPEPVSNSVSEGSRPCDDSLRDEMPEPSQRCCEILRILNDVLDGEQASAARGEQRT